MPRRIAVALVSIASIAVVCASGCATKVGDRVPASFTSYAADRPVIDLTLAEGIRLCLDVKKILGDDQKLRGFCVETAAWSALSSQLGSEGLAASCHANYDSCIAHQSTSDWPDVSDCHDFALGTRGCGALTIGQLSDCLLWRARQVAYAADLGADACDSLHFNGVTADGPPEVDGCVTVRHACNIANVGLF